jgi:hypothetical protein
MTTTEFASNDGVDKMKNETTNCGFILTAPNKKSMFLSTELLNFLCEIQNGIQQAHS